MATATDAWAARTQTPGKNALDVGKLMNLARAKTVDDADKIHAILDAAFGGTPVASSGDFLSSAVKAVSAGINEKVPIEQSLALFAGSMVGTIDPSVGASRLNTFNMALSPSQVDERGRFGQFGKQYGVIGDREIAEGQKRWLELNPNYEREKALKIESEEKGVTNAQRRLAKERGSRQESLAREQQQIDKDEELIGIEEHGHRHLKTADARAKAGLSLKSQKAELEIRKRKLADEKAEDAEAYAIDMENVRLAENRLSTTKANEAHTLQMNAMGEAMKMVPLAQRQALVFKMLEGKSPEDQARILSQIMPAGTVEDIKQLFGPAQLDQMKTVLEKMKNARAADVRAINEGYKKTPIGVEEVHKAKRLEEEVGSVPESAEFADTIIADAESLMRQDPGKYKTSVLPGFMPKGSSFYNEEGAKAYAAAQVLKARMVDYWKALSPEQKAAHPEVRLFLARALHGSDVADVVPLTDVEEENMYSTRARGAWAGITLSEVEFNSTLPFRGGDALGDAKIAAISFDQLQHSIPPIRRGAPVQAVKPSAAPSSTPLPPGARRNGQTFGPAGPSSFGADFGAGAAQGIVSVIHKHYTQNHTHVGNQFVSSSGLFDDGDVPGRLEH
jgi:hypothetical protein